MNIVIDTNVFISASITELSLSQQAVNYCLEQGLVFFSEGTFLELSSRITRPKFDQFTSLERRQAFLNTIYQHRNVYFCEPQATINASPDPDDNQFLEVAVEVNATYLITGDKKHLLPLNPYQGIQIISVRDFLTRQKVLEER